MEVSVAAVPDVETEYKVGWFLGLVWESLVLLLGCLGLTNALGLDDGLLDPWCFLYYQALL